MAWCVSLSCAAQAEPADAVYPHVGIRCPALSADDAAELEARTRAALLTEPERHVDVLVDCTANAAVIVVSAGDNNETASVTLAEPREKEDVLAAIERLIARLASSPPPARPPPPAGTPAPGGVPTPAEPLPPARPATIPAAQPSVTHSAPASRPGALKRCDPPPRFHRRANASFMRPRFSHIFAYGGRVGIEAGIAPWSAGVALGAVTPLEIDDAFVPVEWHGVVFGSVDDRSALGLRFSFGFGASMLAASPSPGVLVRSKTAIAGAFAELGAARPFHFQRLAIVPALGLRLFPAKRSVFIDGRSRFEVPVASVAGLLGASYEF